ncbi:MAG: hypothetical protein OEQ39_21150 [Gammaproteobacteria bacterium]|nr:hypothetical protein [Gammaproteobacteria bacterium]
MITALTLTFIVKKIRINLVHLSLLSATTIVAVSRLLYQFLVGEVSPDVSMSVMAFGQTMFHLTTILVAYLIIASGVFAPTSKYIGFIAFVYVCVAMFQVIVDEQIASELVYRGYQELETSGRGVRSLASEPAVFGNLLLLLSGFFMLIAARERWSAKGFLVLQAVLLGATIFLSQSVYAISVHFIVFLAATSVVSWRLCLVILLAAVWAVVGFLVTIEAEGVRALFILQALIEDPILLYEQGAILRVMNVPVSVYGGVLHGVFGAGFGSGQIVAGSIPALPGYPIPFEIGDRLVGGSVELFLRLGIGAVPLLFFYLFQIIRIGKMRVQIDARRLWIGFPLALVIFLTSFTYSSIANPMVWLLFFGTLAWGASLSRDTVSLNA